LALHGGFIPFGATFLVFHDYMRPAVRLAALMKIPSIFVYTHDSIFVGEDGPTHQPVEHLAAMRCIPRLHVFRPCDANETAWAWQYALERKDGPTAICLSRQNLPVLDRSKYTKAEDTLKGGYILEQDEEKSGEIALIATGSEVHLALAVAAALREAGRSVRVISMPCLELFRAQGLNYQQKILPKRIKKRVVIEAGVRQGWEGILGEEGVFIGVEDFGASGPYQSLAEKYGLTPDKIIDRLAEAGF
ncbi:MAG: transketolase, partial [Planctomycetota bacterium]|nr:transketolase [Planctomycetota bacterium]